MRIFVPATSANLSDELPPAGQCFTAVTRPGTVPDEVELAEFAAQDEAAIASLELLQDGWNPTLSTRRLVLAGDAPAQVLATDPETSVSRATVPSWTWDNVEAILVDGQAAEVAVRAVIDAISQEEADRALNQLWEHALEWFDVSEREILAADLVPGD